MFIDNVTQLMNEKGISQAELSRRTGLPRSSISQYLSGRNKPRDKALEAIAGALGVKTEALTAGDTKLTVKIAADLMGVSEQFVRVAMQQKQLPIGTAVKLTGSKYTYYISPKLFTEYTGIKV